MRAKFRQLSRASSEFSAVSGSSGWSGNDSETLSSEELKVNLKHVSVHLDVLERRLELEANMWTMSLKLPNFLLYFPLFLMGLYTFLPSSAVAASNKQLVDYFHLSQEELGEIASVKDLYEFMANFQSYSSDLMASSPLYWCETRYAHHTWDVRLGAPYNYCESPRMYALGVSSSEGTVAWSSLYTGNINETGEGHWPQEYTDCDDNETALQEYYHDGTLTCRNSAAKVCDNPIAFSACRGTCGYCPPFVYERKASFVKPQKTMLPPVIHQVKRKKKPCKGFAKVLIDIEPNGELITTPSLDGDREGELVTCIDMDDEVTQKWSSQKECPASKAEAKICRDGFYHFASGLEHLGHWVYPQFLDGSGEKIAVMEAIDWIDIQTKEVDVFTLVYSQVYELFSLVSVTFVVNSAGHIEAEKNIVAGRDLINKEPYLFVGCICASMIVCFAGCTSTLFEMIRHRCLPGYRGTFDLFSRLSLILFSIALLIDWVLSEPYAKLFEDILTSYLSSMGGDSDESSILANYYETLEALVVRKSTINAFRIVAYILMYVQFVQLMSYFAFHPRMGIITATVAKATSALAHFGTLFCVIFCFLAFVAHWMLGTHVSEFDTFGGACASQARMLFGEFIFVDSAIELDGIMVVMYWLYGFTFMIIVYFTLLNFFLAIIVDAFSQVKMDDAANMTEHDFVIDLKDVVCSAIQYRRKNWPSQEKVLRKLKARRKSLNESSTKEAALQVMEKNHELLVGSQDSILIDKCPAKEFATWFPELKHEDDLCEYLRFYFLKANVFLSKVKTDKRVRTAPSTIVGHVPSRNSSSNGQSSVDIDFAGFVNSKSTVESEPDWEAHLIELLAKSPFWTTPQVGSGVDWGGAAIRLAHDLSCLVSEYRDLKGYSYSGFPRHLPVPGPSSMPSPSRRQQPQQQRQSHTVPSGTASCASTVATVARPSGGWSVPPLPMAPAAPKSWDELSDDSGCDRLWMTNAPTRAFDIAWARVRPRADTPTTSSGQTWDSFGKPPRPTYQEELITVV